MKLLRCRSINFISQLGIRKTRKLFLCVLFVAFLYVLHVNQFLSAKVMAISRLDKNYVTILSKGRILDFIRTTGEKGANLLTRTEGLSVKAKTLATNISDRTSIQSTSRKNNHHTEEQRYKENKKAEIAATNSELRLSRSKTQEKKRLPKTESELISFPTRVSPFKNKDTQSKSIKTYSSPKLPAKKENQTKLLLKSTILPTVFKSHSEMSTSSKFALSGHLNVHVWKDVCESNVQSLHEFILFPQVPSSRFKINSFQTQEAGNNFGQRIFGFLHPPISGEYKFGISSNNNSELWLSASDSTEHLKRIAFVGSENETKYSEPGNYFKFSSQISKSLYLEQGEKYFVEALYKHAVGKSHVEVVWKLPGESNFRTISQKYISMSVNDSHLKENTVSVDAYWEQSTSSLWQAGGFEPFYRLPFIDETHVVQILPSCPYEPSYYIKGKLVRFQGARNKKNTHFAAVFPPDDTNASLPLVDGEDVWWSENNIGNELVSESVALKIVQHYMEVLRAKLPGVYELHRIITVEQVRDKTKGDRFLLELELRHIKLARNVRLSEFVYNPKGTATLCTPEKFQWNKNATVNIIVPLRNSGRWAFYLVRNIAEIIKQSGDHKVKLVIVDYESSDIDIRQLIGKSSIKNYAIVTIPKKEEFRRAEALQRGSEAVTDPHSILFLCDLHLKIPATLIDIIRKHCVEGKMAFAPVVKRLKCGFYPERPFGYWETLGFGLFAIYKSDYDHVGGMNVAEFKGWGGEDWELLDRVLESQREVERLKISGFYHFFHPSLNGYNQRLHV